MKVILKLGSFMRAVDDPSVIGRICVRLGTKLKPKVLDDI